MHELALSRAIVDTALRHSGGLPVTAVHVRLGDLRQAVPGSLRFCFAIAARDTACAGARLELEPVAALLRCRSCGREWDPAPPPLAGHEGLSGSAIPPIAFFACPRCGSGGDAVRGEELEVAWIEVDEREPAIGPRSGRR
ncbi:MAG: hydrogenase maturation nickel metallochaperone HypA [Acidobacteria bacterium]|nr:MAG: hydrogenase maturation nickel metallochaperone HypA [Acidobacteriota bacterium]MCL4286105.1 hydrogenase maturation nickel metallochaperone HypA [Thermoleophilia bacterium]GIK78421.1 MAG: hydrogenase nickel incorporation protein HypA [Actinomycetes bacterium]